MEPNNKDKGHDVDHSLKSGHSEILIMSFVRIGALYCMFSKTLKKVLEKYLILIYR